MPGIAVQRNHLVWMASTLSTFQFRPVATPAKYERNRRILLVRKSSRQKSWRRRLVPRFTRLNNPRSEEHTSELQSHSDLVCRLLLEKKKTVDHKDVCRIGTQHNVFHSAPADEL